MLIDESGQADLALDGRWPIFVMFLLRRPLSESSPIRLVEVELEIMGTT
jgi:hypothetical protein